MPKLQTTYTPAHRLALNLVYDYPDAKGANTNYLFAFNGVTEDLLYELIDAGDLTGPDRQILRSGSRSDEDYYRFRLTSSGRWWVEHDVLSRLCRDLRERPERRRQLRDATHEHDRATIQQAHELGFVTAHFGGDGRETRLDDYAFRWGRDYYIQLTAYARGRILP